MPNSGIPDQWGTAMLQRGHGQVLGEPYRHSAWVQSAIKMVAGPISCAPPIFCKPINDVRTLTASTQKRYIDKAKSAEIDVEASRAFLRSPIHGGGYAEFIQATVGWLKLKGESFWILDDAALLRLPFPNLKKFPQVIIARPDRMRPILEDKKNVIGWEFLRDNGTVKLLPEQVIHLRCWNPYSDHRGLGSYQSAANATEADWFAGKFIRNLMARLTDSAMGDFVVAKNTIPSDAQREQIITDLRAKREATVRGTYRPVFLCGDFRIEDSMVQNVDADFLAQRRENRTEIFVAFGVPPNLAHIAPSDVEGVNSTHLELIMNTCVPLGEKIAFGLGELATRLTGEQIEVYLDWDEHPVFQQVRRTRFKGVDTLCKYGVPFDTANEYLELGAPKFPSSNQGHIPLGLAPISEINGNARAERMRRKAAENAAFLRREQYQRTK